MILCTNIVINQRNNIIPYNYGIGNEEKMLMLSDIENGSSINNITGEITKIYNTGGQTMLNLKEGNIIEKQI